MTNLLTRIALIMSVLIASSLSLLHAQNIVLMGDQANLTDVPPAAQNAYNWAIANYGASRASYLSFSDVASNGLPAGVTAVWYHTETDTLPANAATVAGTLDAFINNGGGLFLSGYATQLMDEVDSTLQGPTEVIGGIRFADAAMGIRPYDGAEMHPIYAGLPASMWPDPNWGGFRTIEEGQEMREPIAWWTGNTFPGTSLGTAPFLAGNADIVGVGEVSKGMGAIIATSLPGYNWGPASTNGPVEQGNLELFSANVLDYLRAVDPTLLLVADAPDMASVGERVANAYDWAMDAFQDMTSYMSLAEVAANGVPASVEVVWYYLEDSTTLPNSASAAAGNVENFLTNGGGLLLTGFAPQMVADFNGVDGPTEVINNPRNADPAMGVRQTAGTEAHPIFAGLPASPWPDPNWSGFRTVADGVPMREAIAWWTQFSFPGISLGTAPFINPNGEITGVGEIGVGNGAVIVSSLPGYSWATANPDSSQDNLNLFTENMINYLRTVGPSQTLTASVQGGSSPIQEGSEDGTVIEMNLANVIFAPTLSDTAWRVSNLPDGISYTLTRVSETQATLTLAGTPADYDNLITDFTIKVPASEFVNFRSDSVMSVGDVQFEGLVESGIDQVSDLGIRLAPNPATDQLHLSFHEGTPHQVVFHLYDFKGRMIQTTRLAGQSVISLSAVPNGLYLYQISTENGQAFGKIFIQQN